jgi:hypothetical protein
MREYFEPVAVAGIHGRKDLFMSEERTFAGYDGKCPVCGSGDGTIIQGADGKYRNLCRVMGCPLFYHPAPAVGFDTADD